MATFSGAVDGCVPMDAGPSGRARCRKESFSAMVAVVMAMRVGVVVGVVLRRSGRQMWLVGHAAIFFTKSGQGAFACTDHLNFFAARS